MKLIRSQPTLIAVLVATALGVFGGPAARASIITWGTPTTSSGDTDVSTAGTLVQAINIDGDTVTVNGVEFTGSQKGGLSDYVNTDVNWGGSVPPFSALSAEYKELLGSGVYFGGSHWDIKLTLTGLTEGQDYEFQWWTNDSRDNSASPPPPPRYTLATTVGGSPVSLLQPYGVSGALGQFVIGTFTADNTGSQVINYNGLGDSVLNAYQLREMPPPVTVTEHVESRVNVTCNGGANGEIVLNEAEGGSGAPYQYSKDGGLNWQGSTTFSGLEAATYQMKARDSALAESADVPVTITQPAAVVVTENLDPGSHVNVTCNGGTTGQIVLNAATGGTGPDYYYSKDNGITWGLVNVKTFTGLQAGEYKMKAKDGNGCVSPDVPVTITEPAAAVAGTIAKVITLAGSTGAIQWQKSANNIDWTDIGGANTASLDVGDYYATHPYFRAKVTSGLGCNDPVYSSVAKVTDSEPFSSGTVFMFQ